MADAPIGPNLVKVTLQETETPIVFKKETRRSVLFNKQSLGQTYKIDPIKANEGQAAALNTPFMLLPEFGGLYGLVLRPKFEHFHNFLNFGDAPESADAVNPLHFSKYQKSFEDLSGIMPDKDGIISEMQEGDETSLLNFYSWTPIPSIITPKDNNAGTSAQSPTSDDNGNGIFDNIEAATNTIVNALGTTNFSLTDFVTYPFVAAADTNTNDNNLTAEEEEEDNEKRQRNGPKWEYKLTSVPMDEYGKTNSFTNGNSSAAVKKLVPFQEQKQGNGTGNIAGGIHWGLEKTYGIPQRIGFYLDVYTPKSFDFQNKVENTGFNDIFDIANSTYLVVEVQHDEVNDDHYYLVISTKFPPRFYRANADVDGVTREVSLLSEYTSLSSESLLKGVDGYLRLTFMNVQSNLVIFNNINNSPWVISQPVSNKSQDNTTGVDNESTLPGQNDFIQYMTIGGNLRIYGGNLSCGISYNYLSYESRGSVRTSNFSATGEDRTMLSALRLLDVDTNKLPLAVTVKGVDEYGRSTGRVAFKNTADLATDDYGDIDGEQRGDNFIGFTVSDDQKSKLLATTHKITTSRKYTSLSFSRVALTAGRVSLSGEFGYIEMGYVKTPVLQMLVQNFPKIDETPTIIGDIDATILSVDDTWEAEGYHAVKHYGSLTAWMWGENRDGRLANMVGNVFVKLSAESCPETGGGGTLLTGMLGNPSVTEKAGVREVTYEIKDYWKILEDSIILNSPFFDGAIDDSVIKYFLNTVGFSDTFALFPDGQSTDVFGISYGHDAPLTKFKDNMTVAEVIKKTAKKYSKFAMFNRQGSFVYRKVPALFIGHTGGNGEIKKQFAQTHIGTNKNVSPPLGKNDPGGAFTPGDNTEVCYEVKTYRHGTHDIFNNIKILSVDQTTRGLLFHGHTNFESLLDRNSHGYLGYIREFIQQEAAFGSKQSVAKAIREYTRMYRPPYVVSWKTFGGDTSVDIFDVVTVDGARVVVQKIHNSMDGKTKQWWIEWEGEWIWPPQISNGS